MNSPLFSLHRSQKIVSGEINAAAFQPSLRSSLKANGCGLLLFALLNYKRVLLIFWIAVVIFWFVSEVLLVDPEIIDAEPNERQ